MPPGTTPADMWREGSCCGSSSWSQHRSPPTTLPLPKALLSPPGSLAAGEGETLVATGRRGRQAMGGGRLSTPFALKLPLSRQTHTEKMAPLRSILVRPRASQPGVSF
ncbi:Hypothetical predicted protein [Podarcis lilfordi]|uniref:Uncharacterized protein n=1 Tax=Podarcis lilfordi TaxID=74358 RepID=A0AA35PS97_9SAUR|nr:Hypothetical predicted protein [Podarcis lilfordi]